MHLTKKYIKPSKTLNKPAEGLGEWLWEEDGLWEPEGDWEAEADRLVDPEGEVEPEDELLKLVEALPLLDGDNDGLGDKEGEEEWLAPNKPSSSRVCPDDKVSISFLIFKLEVNFADPRGPLSLKELIPPPQLEISNIGILVFSFRHIKRLRYRMGYWQH